MTKRREALFTTIIAVLIASANADERPGGDFSSLTLHGHEGWVSCVAVSPDGRRIITGGHDETIRVWDLRSGKSLMTLRGVVRPEIPQVAGHKWCRDDLD